MFRISNIRIGPSLNRMDIGMTRNDKGVGGGTREDLREEVLVFRTVGVSDRGEDGC